MSRRYIYVYVKITFGFTRDIQGGTLVENPEQIYPNRPPQPPPYEDFVTVYSTSTHFLLCCRDKYYGH